MNNKLLANISSKSNSSSVSSFDRDNTELELFLYSNSDLSNRNDEMQTDKSTNKTVNNQYLIDARNDNNQIKQSKIKQDVSNLDQSSSLLEEMISSLQQKINYFQLKKNALDLEKKQVSKIDEDNQKGSNLLKNISELSYGINKNNAKKVSKKVEKYIDEITNVDEKIHKCIQSIDSKTSFLNQSKTDFLKIQNIIELVKFKIEKEKKHHEIIKMKYKNEFKRLAKERNDIIRFKFDKSFPRYVNDQAIINQQNQILDAKRELSSELKLITSKKRRSNDRLKRMERQLKRLIQAESNIKDKLKSIIERDKKESIITDLLNKLEEKLNEKQIKKEKELHKEQIETQILLRTFDNLLQAITQEKDNDTSEQIKLPDLPFKLIQAKNLNEDNLTNISDEIVIVQNDIKFLKKEIRKAKMTKEKYQAQILDLKSKKDNRMLNNNCVSAYHKQNVDIIYHNSNDLISNNYDDIDNLNFVLGKKRDEVNKRKRKMLTRCEKYFTIIYEYSKNFKD